MHTFARDIFSGTLMPLLIFFVHFLNNLEKKKWIFFL